MDERRIFERFQIELPVKFSYLEGAKEGKGKIINISAGGGGMIVTEHKLLPGTELKMWLSIPDNRDPLEARGEVMWTMVHGPEVYKVGIKFDKVDLMGISRVLRSIKH